jgi:outer membrane protein assembly factor BamE (lipoprotein component of BamABCDE complex)
MRAIIIFAALICLGACMQSNFEHGQRAIADQSMVAQIQKGVTTKQNVAALFGEPQGKHFQANGGETWTYSYHHTEWNPLEVYPTVKSEGASLEIEFDSRGVVQEYAVNNLGS